MTMDYRMKILVVVGVGVLGFLGCSGSKSVTVEGPKTPEEQAALNQMQEMEKQRDQMSTQMVQQMQQMQQRNGNAPATPVEK